MASNDPHLSHKSSTLLSESGNGNAQGENTFLDDLFATMYTYQLEFDVESSAGELPCCFCREFGNAISSYVILRDPNHNEFEVHITRKSKRLYFDEGWFALKDFYSLWFGAWVTFAYVDPALLTIKLTTRWSVEVAYPKHSPPIKRMLFKDGAGGALGSSTFPTSIDKPLPQESFVRSYVKKLTFYDIHSGVLILPWCDFGEHLYDFCFMDLTLIDCSGDRFPCKLKFGVDLDGHLACKISGGWTNLCTVHGFVEGDAVKFSIKQPTHDYEMYLSFYPEDVRT